MTSDDTSGASGLCPERLDRTLDALAHHRRRRALYHLRDAADAVTIDSLADAVADAESDADAERVLASLHHRHVPKLADVGVVDHDPRSGDVRFAADGHVESWLDRLADVECVE